jgi:MFS transporter, UMF1 family
MAKTTEMNFGLNRGVTRREVWAWAMFDFANSGYTTVVLTAVYNAYFVNGIAAKADWATLALTVTLSLSYLLTMILMPAIGAYADAKAAKKRLLAVATVSCVLFTAMLALPLPGDVVFAAALLCLSNFAFSVCESLCAAFLPELATPQAMGRVSGWGWSLGYFGGMLTLGLSIVYITLAQKQGVAASVFVPNTMLITAAVFALAVIPTFIWLKERAVPTGETDGAISAISQSFAQLSRNWRELPQFVDFRQLLFCATFYQAGISVVITLSAVYAEAVMKFTQQDTMILLFVVNIAAFAGAFAFGYLQDRFGHKRMLGATLFGWLIMIVLAYLSDSKAMFWVAALFAGLCMGSSQSCGRALAGLLAPPQRAGEFFGIWAFATRLAAILGPITYGLVTYLTGGNHRVGILITGVFFVIGLILLRPVDIERGRGVANSVTDKLH